MAKNHPVKDLRSRIIKNVSKRKSVNVVTAEVTPEANERLTVDSCPAHF